MTSFSAKEAYQCGTPTSDSKITETRPDLTAFAQALPSALHVRLDKEPDPCQFC